MGNASATPRRSFARKLLIALVLGALLLGAAAWIGMRLIERHVAGLLGPRAQVADVRLGFDAVVLTDVKIAGAEGVAPASAQRVVAEPDWGSLLRRQPVFRKITIEGFDFAVLRSADGDMQISPALQAALREADGDGGRARDKGPIRVDDIVLDGGRLDFIDSAIAKPPHRIPFENVSARLHPLVLPADGQQSQMEFK